jgi:hypothetical protein
MIYQRARPAALFALAALIIVGLALVAAPARAAPPAQDTATTTATATATPTPTATTPTATPTATTAPTATTPALAPAQALRLEITKSLLGSDEVQVGQYLTFSIQITNTGSVVVTDLPVVDEYDTSILQPALDQIEPPPTSSEPGLLRWDNLTTSVGDLEPGRSVTITAVFRAIRIDDEVINRARIEAGVGSGGEGGAPVEDAAGGKVRGGRVVVEKALVESFVQLDTPVISFTLSLRNEGFADIVRAPLADTYRADLLSFISASVPPDFHDPATGELRWDDLLASLGVARLAPQESVSFTTVYSVTGPIEDAVVNRANAVNVADEFGNAVASPRQAEVRIRLRGPGGADLPTATPTATATAPAQDEDQPRREPSATATSPAPTTTSSAAPTATSDVTPEGAEATPTAVEPGTTADGAAAGGAADANVEAIPATLPATGAVARTPLGLALVALLIGLVLRAAGRGRSHR